MENIGLYIHVPFCKSICPYCDFYKIRLSGNESIKAEYVKAVKKEIKKHKESLASKVVDTIYFGGGTPSSLSAADFEEIFCEIYSNFSVSKDAEITVEINPSSEVELLVPKLSKLGVNRISFGMQSAVDFERKKLGRISGKERLLECIEVVRIAGITNISIDLMIGIPGQTHESLLDSLEFIKDTGVPHVSAYMLKLEEGTVFYERNKTGELALPSEDETIELYKTTCEFLESIGLMQYEISNFSKPSFESKHNLKYWNTEEYLGIGPAAHSFIFGKRMYYDSNIEEFINSPMLIYDSDGGSFSERLMLSLRLVGGYTGLLPESILEKVKNKKYESFLVLEQKENDIYNLRLTREGFLVSNYIISELI
ncbi:MAG: radical SAM family heme chaperone HemW [Oscillospiraceae bacterium]|nr:radical SAM family heme chaperone HemW [Oscillospiraceae bacterium]